MATPDAGAATNQRVTTATHHHVVAAVLRRRVIRAPLARDERHDRGREAAHNHVLRVDVVPGALPRVRIERALERFHAAGDAAHGRRWVRTVIMGWRSGAPHVCGLSQPTARKKREGQQTQTKYCNIAINPVTSAKMVVEV